MATTPPMIGGADPSVLRSLETQKPSVARTSPPTVSASTGSATSGGTAIARSIAPQVSGDTITYNQATQTVSGASLTITSATNNEPADVVTVFNSNKAISVSAVNQTVNSYNVNTYSGNEYTNDDVANFLPTFTGTVGAGNVTVTGTVYTSGISSAGLASLTILNVSTIANLGAVSNLIITGGTGGQYLQTDGTGNLSWAAGGGGGNGSPGGANTQVQFNDAGAFGGNSAFTFNKTTGALAVTGNGTFGNVSATTFTGALTGAATSATTAGTVTTAAQGNITSVGTLTSLNSSGTVTAPAFTANTGVFTGNASGLSSLVGANVSGFVPNANVANTAFAVALANVSGVGNIASINLDGNLSNILYGNGVFASAPAGGGYGNSNVATFLASYGSNTMTTTGNVSVGNIIGNGQALTGLAGANVTGQVTYAATANAVAGANVSGAVTYATTANSVAVANVSGIGNISTINLNGNSSQILYGNGVFAAASVAVSYGDSNVATFLASYGSNTITTTGNVSVGNIIGNGQALTGIAGGNVSGAVSFATTANAVAGANVSGTVASATSAASANAVAGANVSGAVSFATTANAVAGANVSGAVSFAATANSVAVANVSGIGNIATINKDGNASNILYGNGVFASAPAGGVYGDSNVVTLLASYGSNTITTTGNVSVGNIIGNGQALTGLAGGNVSGQVGNALVSGTVYTNAQPNITSVGTLTSLSVTGNANVGNLGTATAIITTGNITTINSGLLQNGNSNITITSNGNISLSAVGAPNEVVITSTGVNVAGTLSVTGNVTGGNISTGIITLTNGAVIKDTVDDAVAFGQGAGNTSQGAGSIAIGFAAGNTAQGGYSVGVGREAGSNAQGGLSVAIGFTAGYTSQGTYALAIGASTGYNTQGTQAVAIGASAGYANQGASAVAVGFAAGGTNQASNSIILNATGTELNQTTANTFTVAPVRNDVANIAQVMFYNTTSKEVTYGNTISVAGNVIGGNISTTGNISGNTNGFTIGYLNVPQISAANATLALTDAGKHYYSTTAGNLTLTIPTNASVAFATGTAISIVVQAAGNVLVNATSGVTLYMGGNATAGNRVVGTYGMATLMKVASDTWFISGAGVA